MNDERNIYIMEAPNGWIVRRYSPQSYANDVLAVFNSLNDLADFIKQHFTKAATAAPTETK